MPGTFDTTIQNWHLKSTHLRTEQTSNENNHKRSHGVLSNITTLSWAAFTVIIGHGWSVGCGMSWPMKHPNV